MANVLSDEWFQYFRGRCRHYIERFGLTDWDVVYRREELGGGLAQCHTSRQARNATISVTDVWPDSDEFSLRKLDEVALHEVLELLLDDMELVAWCDYKDDEDRTFDISQARHAVIHRLTHSGLINMEKSDV